MMLLNLLGPPPIKLEMAMTAESPMIATEMTIVTSQERIANEDLVSVFMISETPLHNKRCVRERLHSDSSEDLVAEVRKIKFWIFCSGTVSALVFGMATSVDHRPTLQYQYVRRLRPTEHEICAIPFRRRPCEESLIVFQSLISIFEVSLVTSTPTKR